MDNHLRVLIVDAGNGFYKIQRYKIGDYFGPVDLGMHLSAKYSSLNIGTGLLAGSIFPGSNRLVFTGYSPCWNGFYISSMGGAGLVFDNLGINILSVTGKAPTPSILFMNRNHGEEIEIEVVPVNIETLWLEGRRGIYSLMDYTYTKFGHRYQNDPRVLATGPASRATDIGGICSVPVKKGELSFVDTWAGRGGFGSKLYRDHGIVSVIYGGTHIDEDFRDRKVADEWFKVRYDKKMAAKDIEATTKYRYDPTFNTGGTFGVNYAKIGGALLAFNYRSIEFSEEERLKIHSEFILNNYLKQFNRETIEKKQQSTCGEPCGAVCKKMNNRFKKDYEPYQAMGPLCGIFDQRAAEELIHHCDMLGFDAISAGGVLSWLMETLHEGIFDPEDLGVSGKPVFAAENFRIVADSAKNAKLGKELLDSIIKCDTMIDLSRGVRYYLKNILPENKKEAAEYFVYTASGRDGWMVPNQYWTPGVLSPMPIMGKYYMHYGSDFLPPRELGRKNAERLIKELILDNTGMCRFHRQWAEEMVPDIIGSLYDKKEEFLESIRKTAYRIASSNKSVFWESRKNIDFIHTFLRRKKYLDGNKSAELQRWENLFEINRREAAIDFWYEIHKGILETLIEGK